MYVQRIVYFVCKAESRSLDYVQEQAQLTFLFSRHWANQSIRHTAFYVFGYTYIYKLKYTM